MPKNDDTSALSRAQDILTQFLAEYQAMKQGRRHSAGDEAMLNVIHDLAVELGAVCPGVGGEEEEQEMPSDDGEMKTLTLWEIHDRVWNAMWSLVRPDYGVSGYDAEGAAEWGIADIYPEYAILTHYPDGLFYQVAYAVDDAGTVTVAERNDWTVVTREWLEAKRFDSTLVMPGGEVKAVKQGEEIGLVSGYLVRFSTADDTDLEGDFFTKDTDFGPHQQSIVFYHHGLDRALGVKTLGRRLPASLKKDDIGVWIEAQLDLRDEYEQAIFGMAQQGKQGWSSGTASHLVRRMPVQGKAANWIANWPLGLDASLTPAPAEPRNVAAAKAMSLKMYQRLHEQAPSLKAALQASGEDATAAAGGGMPATPASDTPAQIEESIMNPEELKALLAEVVQGQLAPVVSEVNGLKAALSAEPPSNDPGYQLPGDSRGGAAGEETFKAFYVTRFGNDENGIKAQVMKEITGGNYERFVWEQNAAFAKFLRWGDRELTREEVKLLRRQVFAPTHVMMMIKNGFPVAAIKDTMVTAQGSLGGYAMPPNMQEGIATRLPGLTAVRGNGATVITLLGGTSTTVTRYTGGDNRYVGNLRGQWGAETQDPTEQNATLGEDEVLANTYTYKIVMSQDLVDGAANLVELVADDVLMTMAIDEDEADLVGDGAGKPLGILPSGVNALSLAEVNSGGASALTTSGIKKLKRGIASQYRGRGVFVGNSDTYGLVEVLTVSGTGSDFAFPDLSETGRLLNRPAAESEAMPDVASNAYPLIFGDMSGYYIVEQPGMTMARFQDSGTGINKVEFQVRRKRGGRPVKLWLFAVQKVAA